MSSKTANSPQSGWRALYPYTPQRFSLPDGHQMSFVDEGQGQPILMVHGNPTWSFYYHHLIAEMRPHARCVAVDHMGCGRSDRPQQYDYSLDRHIDNLVELIDHLKLEQITLVAHDWGGAIGLGAVRRRPDLFAKIALLNTAAFPPPFFPLRIRLCRVPWLGTWGMRHLNLFARAAITMATELPRGLPRDVAEGLLAPYDSWDNRVAIDRFVHDIPTRSNQQTWQTLESIEQFLPTLELPVKLIWGMKDWCFRPECLQRFINIWPQADVLRFPDAGHYIMLDKGDEVSQAINNFVLGLR